MLCETVQRSIYLNNLSSNFYKCSRHIVLYKLLFGGLVKECNHQSRQMQLRYSNGINTLLFRSFINRELTMG